MEPIWQDNVWMLDPAATSCLPEVTPTLSRERLGAMTSVSIVPVDERDSRWEDHRPRFRVYLHGNGESSTGG